MSQVTKRKKAILLYNIRFVLIAIPTTMIIGIASAVLIAFCVKIVSIIYAFLGL